MIVSKALHIEDRVWVLRDAATHLRRQRGSCDEILWGIDFHDANSVVVDGVDWVLYQKRLSNDRSLPHGPQSLPGRRADHRRRIHL